MMKMLPTNINCTKDKSYNDIYDKCNCNISNKVIGEELDSNNVKDLINNYNIGKVDDKVTWMEEGAQINVNCIKSKLN